jgi:hypothetical protein
LSAGRCGGKLLADAAGLSDGVSGTDADGVGRDRGAGAAPTELGVGLNGVGLLAGVGGCGSWMKLLPWAGGVGGVGVAGDGVTFEGENDGPAGAGEMPGVGFGVGDVGDVGIMGGGPEDTGIGENEGGGEVGGADGGAGVEGGVFGNSPAEGARAGLLLEVVGPKAAGGVLGEAPGVSFVGSLVRGVEELPALGLSGEVDFSGSFNPGPDREDGVPGLFELAPGTGLGGCGGLDDGGEAEGGSEGATGALALTGRMFVGKGIAVPAGGGLFPPREPIGLLGGVGGVCFCVSAGSPHSPPPWTEGGTGLGSGFNFGGAVPPGSPSGPIGVLIVNPFVPAGLGALFGVCSRCPVRESPLPPSARCSEAAGPPLRVVCGAGSGEWGVKGVLEKPAGVISPFGFGGFGSG